MISSRRILVPLLAATIGWAHAATFTVDTTSDAVDAVPGDGVCATATGACSLRAAVQEANALAGPDTIDLPAGTYVLTLAGPPEDAGASGDLDVHETLTIAGAGAATTIIDGNGASQVIEAGLLTEPTPRQTLTLTGVTVRNGAEGDSCDSFFFGQPRSFGGAGGVCVAIFGLTLVDSVVEGNRGVGIAAILSPVTLTRSTVRDQRDSDGISLTAPLATIADSTISGNEGIGLIADGGTLGGTVDIRNSTISGNSTTVIGAQGTGIYAGVVCEEGFDPPCSQPVSVTLNNVTITGHTGPAVRNDVYIIGGSPPVPDNPPVYVSNSVLAGNGTECQGKLRSRGYNLLQTLSGCPVVDDTTGNVVGLPAKLGPLQNNGGPTETHALLPGSPAINAANPAAPGSGGSACEAADQRGTARPVGGRCDMGAYEGPCGDGSLDPGEECDDGNATDGDGCQHNCTFPGCGNSIVEPGEQCDDGGTAAGDCCSSTCQLDAAGTPCTSDDNVCTDDICDGSGTCTHAPNTAPCSDGNPCTLGDVCTNGRCAPQQFGCGDCMICTSSGCVPPPATCTPADPGKSRITIHDEVDPADDRVAWTWQATGPVTKTDFGDPTHSFLGWRLCVYDSAGGAFLLAVASEPYCNVFSCWTETPKGFSYEQGKPIPGKVRIKLTAGSPAKIAVKARGTSNGVPPLPLGLPVRVGLYHADGFYSSVHGCWDATYSLAGRNSATLFRARSD